MAVVVGIPWYRREDWERLMEIFEDADILHDTFEDWRKDAGNTEGSLRRQGQIVVRAYIDPEAFPDWCRAKGVGIDAQARAQFASETASGEHAGQAGDKPKIGRDD